MIDKMYGRRKLFLDNLRPKCNQNHFDVVFSSLSEEDQDIVQAETYSVLQFMKDRDCAFEEFPDLVEVRLRKKWRMEI